LILVGTAPNGSLPGSEGYEIRVDRVHGLPDVFVRGADARGVLFGVGRLLREMQMSRGAISISRDLQIATAPKVALRGHQLGYRPKTNSYDGWTVAMWDQYIRDLAIFGTNAIELIPPRSDDEPDSPHFTLPPMQMMIEMDRIIDRYGLDVWIWYPALDPDYTTPEAVDRAVREWAEVFEKLPRVDAVFVPGGDPGHTKPSVLFALLEKQAASLRKYHPHAQLWMSPQGFNKAWMDEFYDLLRPEPRWLTGIVFGPQERDSFQTLRERVPARYPIRHYPDITHSLRAQYPVPDWDIAHALTSGREPINPRPTDEAAIFRRFRALSIGFITYSEGNNDDVNKIVWSALGWDPDADVNDILSQYSRYFIGEPLSDRYARGLLALEENWRGPLFTSDAWNTLARFKAMERDATPQQLLNWRFQQGLYRAYYDAYVRARLISDTIEEKPTMQALRAARTSGANALTAIADAERLLQQQPLPLDAATNDWRLRVYALAEALFQSARVQSSVARYRAIGIDRGATLDTVERPLNNRLWLAAQFQRIRAMSDEQARLDAIDRIISWTDPGPGGFYDDLGNPEQQPHLVTGSVGFSSYHPDWRLSWMTHAESFYDAPLTMRYTGLDPNAHYRLRIIYGGDVFGDRTRIRLVANDTIEIAPPTAKPQPTDPVEYDVPADATHTGTLTLTWTEEAGLGGSGRGCQVAEVWLLRTDKPASP
jgi:hypothetical protein